MKLHIRYFSLIFAGLFLSVGLHAQGFKLQKADRYFENTYYSEAIPLYETLLKGENDAGIRLKLADAYYYTFQLAEAVSLYGRLAGAHPEKMDQAHYFQYVQALKALGNYARANQITQEKLLAEKETEKFVSELHYLENVKAIGSRFEMKNLPLNTTVSEFGGIVHKDQFVFAATRENSGLFEKIFHWNGLPYLNLYRISVDSLSEGSTAQLFSAKLTTRFHESNAVFSSDGKIVYFTRNNYVDGKKTRDKNHVTQLQIYKAELANNVWTNVVSLPINNDSYSNEHPALSPDGKVLYFASNRPGGHGSFDLYQVETETFENPQNLGAHINTKHKEQFPFITSNGDLYFSSDGHPGFGFLDVFVSKSKGEGFSNPDNVGLPVNSGYDDFAFMINPESKEGFVSSNRSTGKGNDDIYSIKETKPLLIEDCYQLLAGKVVDEVTGELLPGAKVTLFHAEKPVDSLVVSIDAVFNFKIECETAYRIAASKPSYRGDSISFKTNAVRKKKNELILELLSEKTIAKRIKEKETEEKRIAEAKFQAEKVAKKKAKTAAEKTKKAREKATAKRKAAAEKANQKRIADIVEKEKSIEKEDNRFLIKTEPIYFDYDLWYVRKEAREKLNKVINIMKKYPEMSIEIGTHTDVRGSLNYNEELSQKRSNSVMGYFENQGIDTDRLTAKGYGESRPIIQCVPDDSCTEEQHEINRRCEFEIISFFNNQ